MSFILFKYVRFIDSLEMNVYQDIIAIGRVFLNLKD